MSVDQPSLDVNWHDTTLTLPRSVKRASQAQVSLLRRAQATPSSHSVSQKASHDMLESASQSGHP